MGRTSLVLFLSATVLINMFVEAVALFSSEQMPVHHMGDLITSIRNYFHSKCVFLVYLEDEIGRGGMWELVQLQKQLVEPHLQVATLQITMLKYMTHEHKHPCNKPLYVISATTSNITRRAALAELWKWTDYHHRCRRMKWLLYLQQSESFLEILEDANIALDYEFFVAQRQTEAIQLTEVYRVHEKLPLHVRRVGKWSHTNGLQYTSNSFYRRRERLKGIIIRATVEKTSLLTEVEVEDGHVKEVGGLYGKIWSVLEENMQFKTVYDSSVGWGEKLANGSWNGMIGRVFSGEVDVAVSDFHYVAERMRVVDYLLPIVNTSFVLYVRDPDMEEINWNGYLAPFRWQLWVAVMAAILLLSLGINAICRIWSVYGDPEPCHYTFSVSLYCVLGSFCSQGLVPPPKNWSSRTVFLSCYLTSLVILAVYSGALMSSLTVRKSSPLPFQKYEDLLHLENFELGLPSKATLSLISGTVSVLRKIYERSVDKYQNGVVKNALDAYHKLCINRRYTFLQSSYYFYALRAKGAFHCKIVDVPETTVRTSVSIIISQSSHYRNVFNYKLRQMITSGIVNRYKRIYWNFKDDERTDASRIVVHFETVLPLLVFLGAGIFVSILLLLLEFIKYRLKH